MPRLNGRPPKYRHHKSSGRGYVVLNGDTLYLGKFSSPASIERYHRTVAEWLASGGALAPTSRKMPPPASRQIHEVILAYWDHAKQYYRTPDGVQTTEVVAIKQALRVISGRG